MSTLSPSNLLAWSQRFETLLEQPVPVEEKANAKYIHSTVISILYLLAKTDADHKLVSIWQKKATLWIQLMYGDSESVSGSQEQKQGTLSRLYLEMETILHYFIPIYSQYELMQVGVQTVRRMELARAWNAPAPHRPIQGLEVLKSWVHQQLESAVLQSNKEVSVMKTGNDLWKRNAERQEDGIPIQGISAAWGDEEKQQPAPELSVHMYKEYTKRVYAELKRLWDTLTENGLVITSKDVWVFIQDSNAAVRLSTTYTEPGTIVESILLTAPASRTDLLSDNPKTPDLILLSKETLSQYPLLDEEQLKTPDDVDRVELYLKPNRTFMEARDRFVLFASDTYADLAQFIDFELSDEFFAHLRDVGTYTTLKESNGFVTFEELIKLPMLVPNSLRYYPAPSQTDLQEIDAAAGGIRWRRPLLSAHRELCVGNVVMACAQFMTSLPEAAVNSTQLVGDGIASFTASYAKSNQAPLSIVTRNLVAAAWKLIASRWASDDNNDNNKSEPIPIFQYDLESGAPQAGSFWSRAWSKTKRGAQLVQDVFTQGNGISAVLGAVQLCYGYQFVTQYSAGALWSMFLEGQGQTPTTTASFLILTSAIAFLKTRMTTVRQKETEAVLDLLKYALIGYMGEVPFESDRDSTRQGAFLLIQSVLGEMLTLAAEWGARKWTGTSYQDQMDTKRAELIDRIQQYLDKVRGPQEIAADLTSESMRRQIRASIQEPERYISDQWNSAVVQMEETNTSLFSVLTYVHENNGSIFTGPKLKVQFYPITLTWGAVANATAIDQQGEEDEDESEEEGENKHNPSPMAKEEDIDATLYTLFLNLVGLPERSSARIQQQK